MGRELSNRQAGTLDGERRDDRIDTGTIGKASINQRLTLIDAATNLCDDSLDDTFGHFVRNKTSPRQFQNPFLFHEDLIALHDHDFADRWSPQQVLQWTIPEYSVLQIFFQRSQDDVFSHFAMQVRPYQRKDLRKCRFNSTDPGTQIGFIFDLHFFARENQQILKFGFSLGNQGRRQIELVVCQARQQIVSRTAPFKNQLIDQKISQCQSDDLFEQRFVFRAEQIEFATDVFNIAFQQDDRISIAGPLIFNLIQIETFEQLSMDSLIQVSHDRPQVCFQFRAANGRDFVRFKGQRIRPDPNGLTRLEQDRIATQDFLITNEATVDSDVLQFELPVFS